MHIPNISEYLKLFVGRKMTSIRFKDSWFDNHVEEILLKGKFEISFKEYKFLISGDCMLKKFKIKEIRKDGIVLEDV